MKQINVFEGETGFCEKFAVFNLRIISIEYVSSRHLVFKPVSRDELKGKLLMLRIFLTFSANIIQHFESGFHARQSCEVNGQIRTMICSRFGYVNIFFEFYLWPCRGSR